VALASTVIPGYESHIFPFHGSEADNCPDRNQTQVHSFMLKNHKMKGLNANAFVRRDKRRALVNAAMNLPVP
jgi:hypothetical protein